MSGENRGGDVGNAFRICSCNSNGLFRSFTGLERCRNYSGSATESQSAAAAVTTTGKVSGVNICVR